MKRTTKGAPANGKPARYKLTAADKERIGRLVENERAAMFELSQYPEFVLGPFLAGIARHLEALHGADDYDACHLVGGDYLVVLHGLAQAHGHLERAADVYAVARREYEQRKAERAAAKGGAK